MSYTRVSPSPFGLAVRQVGPEAFKGGGKVGLHRVHAFLQNRDLPGKLMIVRADLAEPSA